MKKKTSMEWDPLAGAGENARRQLPSVAAEFFALGRAAAQAGSEPARLHAFRLAAKRFRYTLELFRPVYGPGLDVRIEAVRKIQSMLGDRQDFAVLSARLRNALAPSDALLDALRACEEKGQALEERFGAYWREEYDLTGAELRWMRYLTRRPPAARVRPKPDPPVEKVAPATRKRPSRTARTRR
jgi:CHAD domain-containing protein